MSEAIHDAQRLKELQALPLERKVLITQARIIEFNNWAKGNICVSVSGGKDSTVLADIVRKISPDAPLVFANTGLEYPENQKLAKEMGAVFVRPKMQFSEVISTYGYPVLSKETAEAIYYARRIKPAERERTAERKRAELMGRRVLPLEGKHLSISRHRGRGTGAPSMQDESG